LHHRSRTAAATARANAPKEYLYTSSVTCPSSFFCSIPLFQYLHRVVIDTANCHRKSHPLSMIILLIRLDFALYF
jgi:hypothetical protein